MYYFIFDTSRGAYIDDEEYLPETNVKVVIGPRPRFFSPLTQNFYYAGDEWYFKLYSSQCKSWRIQKGYAPPRFHPDRIQGLKTPH